MNSDVLRMHFNNDNDLLLKTVSHRLQLIIRIRHRLRLNSEVADTASQKSLLTILQTFLSKPLLGHPEGRPLQQVWRKKTLSVVVKV